MKRKLSIRRTDSETIDVRFLMKGAFKSRVDLCETFGGMKRIGGNAMEQTMIKVLDTVGQMTA